MSYSIHEVDRGLGKLVTEVICDNTRIAQVAVDDNVYFRAYDDGRSHRGVLFIPNLTVDEKKHQTFKSLVERIEICTGKSSGLKTDAPSFVDYVKRKGASADVGYFDLRLRIQDKRITKHVWNSGYYSPKMYSYLRETPHIMGLMTSIGGILTSASVLFSAPDIPLYISLPLIGCSTLPEIIGVRTYADLCMPAQNGRRGPLFSLGHAPSFFHRLKNLKDPQFVLGKFLEAHREMESLGNCIKQQRRYTSLLNTQDYYFGFLREIFGYTTLQKGFSISLKSHDFDSLYDTFAEILHGSGLGEAEDANPSEPSPIIDPWDVEIPEIQNVLEVEG